MTSLRQEAARVRAEYEAHRTSKVPQECEQAECPVRCDEDVCALAAWCETGARIAEYGAELKRRLDAGEVVL